MKNFFDVLAGRSTLGVVLIVSLILVALGFEFAKLFLTISAILFFTFVVISLVRNVRSF